MSRVQKFKRPVWIHEITLPLPADAEDFGQFVNEVNGVLMDSDFDEPPEVKFSWNGEELVASYEVFIRSGEAVDGIAPAASGPAPSPFTGARALGGF